jgi:hypothetical protein
MSSDMTRSAGEEDDKYDDDFIHGLLSTLLAPHAL